MSWNLIFNALSFYLTGWQGMPGLAWSLRILSVEKDPGMPVLFSCRACLNPKSTLFGWYQPVGPVLAKAPTFIFLGAGLFNQEDSGIHLYISDRSTPCIRILFWVITLFLLYRLIQKKHRRYAEDIQKIRIWQEERKHLFRAENGLAEVGEYCYESFVNGALPVWAIVDRTENIPG